MGFFDKLKAGVGIGQPKVNLHLSSDAVHRGETLICTLEITGGTRELEMNECGISVYQYRETVNEKGETKSHKKRIYRDAIPLDKAPLKPEEEKSWEIRLKIPTSVNPSDDSVSYKIVGFLDVPGLDPQDKQELTIKESVVIEHQKVAPEAPKQEEDVPRGPNGLPLQGYFLEMYHAKKEMENYSVDDYLEELEKLAPIKDAERYIEPASLREIETIEERMGVRFSDFQKEFLMKNYYKWNNDFAPRFSIESFNSYFQDEFGYHNTLRENNAVESQKDFPEGVIKKMSWSPKWFPAESQHFVDLDPDQNGTHGQIIEVAKSYVKLSYMYTSFRDILSTGLFKEQKKETRLEEDDYLRKPTFVDFFFREDGEADVYDPTQFPVATVEQVEAFEQVVGTKFTKDLKRFLQLFDYDGPGFWDFDFAPLSELRRIYEANLAEQGNQSPTESKWIDEGIVEDTWWSNAWIPIARKGNDELMLVDLRPGKYGKYTQVLRWHREKGITGHLGRTFIGFLVELRWDIPADGDEDPHLCYAYDRTTETFIRIPEIDTCWEEGNMPNGRDLLEFIHP